MGFTSALAELVAWLPPPVAVILLAMSPVGEVRISIPIAILVYEMGWAEAFTWSLIGNFAIVPVLHVAYPWLEKMLRKWPWADRRIDRIYARTRRKTEEKVRRYEEFAVFMFIATPVPGTGAWSGALVAHVFGMDFRRTARFYYAAIVASCLLTALFVELGVWGFRQF